MSASLLKRVRSFSAPANALPCPFAMAPKLTVLRKQQRIDRGEDERAAKMQKLVNMKDTSGRSLHELMKALGEETSRHYQTDVGHGRFATMAKSLDLPLRNGGTWRWELCNPADLLFRIVSESTFLQDAFKAALRERPCSAERPWRLLVGWDEFVPGNKLAAQHSRKCMNLSFSFEELGPLLSLDVVWFTPVIARASMMAEVDGGWSAMLREFLKLFLLGSGGLQSAEGVALDLGGGVVTTLHARVGRLLSDGDGLRLAMQWKGAACTKPCWRHSNVFMKNCSLLPRGGDDAKVDITCADPTKFALWSQSDFNDAVDVVAEASRRCADGELPKARLEEISKCFGLSATPNGLLADEELRATFNALEVFRYDWVHTFLSNGVLTTDLWALVCQAEKLRLSSQRQLSDFLRDWQVPKHNRSGSLRCVYRPANIFLPKENPYRAMSFPHQIPTHMHPPLCVRHTHAKI